MDGNKYIISHTPTFAFNQIYFWHIANLRAKKMSLIVAACAFVNVPCDFDNFTS